MPRNNPAPLIAGLQRRLLVLLVVVMLPLFGLLIAMAWQGQSHSLADSREKLQVLSRVAALGAERHVEGTRQLLNAISSGPSLKNTGLDGLCGEFLANIRRSYPYYSNLSFLKADGSIRCHALTSTPAGNFKDRSYFTRALASKAFSMGSYQIGRVSGVASLGFAVPVYEDSGDLKGFAYAALTTAQLAKALSVALPPDVCVTLTDREGTIVGVDSSQNSALIGTAFPDKALLVGQPVNAVAEASDSHGVPTLYGLSSVADDSGPALYVVASQPRSAVTAPAWRALIQQLLWITALALLGVAVARWLASRTLVEPARSLLARMRQLGRDVGVVAPPIPVGADAMGTLSLAFDRFAHLLRERDVERSREQALLQTVQSRLLVAQRIANTGNWELDLASQQMWWSDQTYAIFGLDAASFTPSLDSIARLIFPDDSARYELATTRFFSGEGSLELECRMVGKGGRIRWIRTLGEVQFDGNGHPVVGSGTVQDITDRVVNERLLAAESRALLALSLDMPLTAVLEEVLIGLESVLPGALATVLTLTPDGQRIQGSVSLGLPASFCQALEGLPIGPAAGTCGTAAYRRETVVVEDIDTDPLWADYRELAHTYGLRACWSTPVQNAAGVVLATFAIYYKQPRKPRADELELAQRAASVIGIAIERDRKDADLRASEQRFRSSFLGASAGMVISTLDGRVVEANSAYCRMLGYTAEELYTLSARDLVHPKDLPRRRAQINAIKAGRINSFVSEDRYLTKTGEVVWIRVSISILRGTAGQADGFVVIAEDINQQRETMQALQQTQAALNMASRVGRMGAWWVDVGAQPLVIELSDVACEIYGIASGSVLTKDAAIAPYIGEHADRLRMLFDACAVSAQPFDEEFQITNAAGQVVWVRSIGEAVRNADDLIVRVQGTIQDISNRKQAEVDILRLNAELEDRVAERTAQLEAANKELEAFSYSVSHDLRAPLQTVSGFTQLLDKSNGGNLTDKGRHYLQRIRTSSAQMSDLIQGLMSLAELNRKALKTGSVNLSAIAQRVAQDCRDSDPDREVEVHIAAGLMVWGDPTLLGVVLQNLIGNAWKYTSRRSDARIEVGAQTAPDGTPAYFVQDNGAGFDMAYAASLFVAFQRLHAASDFSGSGIGLANVKRVISRHGGRVWATGQAGQGATFYFTLPPEPDTPDGTSTTS